MANPFASTSGCNASGSGGGAAAAANPSKQIPFLTKLRAMVDDHTIDDTIHWRSNGLSIIITNEDRFARVILPRYFKTITFASFARQMNMYGFNKVPSVHQGALLNTQTVIRHEYKHAQSNFVRGRLDLVANIKRKMPTMKRKAGSPEVTEGAELAEDADDHKGAATFLADSSTALNTTVGQLNLSQNESQEEIWQAIHVLQEQNQDLNKRVEQQQNVIDRLFLFLDDYFARLEGSGNALGEQGWQGQSHDEPFGSVGGAISNFTSGQQRSDDSGLSSIEEEPEDEGDEGDEHSNSQISQPTSRFPESFGRREAIDQHQRDVQQQQHLPLPPPPTMANSFAVPSWPATSGATSSGSFRPRSNAGAGTRLAPMASSDTLESNSQDILSQQHFIVQLSGALDGAASGTSAAAVATDTRSQRSSRTLSSAGGSSASSSSSLPAKGTQRPNATVGRKRKSSQM